MALFATILFGYGYIAINVDKFGLYNSYIDPVILASLSFFVTAGALFFVYDRVFLRWLIFAPIWWLFSVIIISMTPEYSGGFIVGYSPDRSTVAFGLGISFVIISLAKLVWDTKKLR